MPTSCKSSCNPYIRSKKGEGEKNEMKNEKNLKKKMKKEKGIELEYAKRGRERERMIH